MRLGALCRPTPPPSADLTPEAQKTAGLPAEIAVLIVGALASLPEAQTRALAHERGRRAG